MLLGTKNGCADEDQWKLISHSLITESHDLQNRERVRFFYNPILFAICTSTFSRSCKRLVEECSLALLCIRVKIWPWVQRDFQSSITVLARPSSNQASPSPSLITSTSDDEDRENLPTHRISIPISHGRSPERGSLRRMRLLEHRTSPFIKRKLPRAE
jgi:hypothetical protein